MVRKFLRSVFVCLVSLVMVGCMSIQRDIIVFTQEELEEIKSIEIELYNLDARNFEGVSKETQKTYLAECNALIMKINDEVKQMGQNDALKSRLYALQGRVYLLIDKESKAKDMYKLSAKTYSGETQTIILGYRLGLVDDIESDDVKSLSSEKYLLVLETALACYGNKEYKSAVANFDKAFLEMEDEYKAPYLSIRNKAWQFKDIENLTSDKGIMEILIKNEITVSEMLLLTQDTTELLLPYTQGKVYKEDELYKIMSKSGVLKSVSALDKDSNVTASKNDVLTRKICARYLWNIFNYSTPQNLTRYSQLFRSYNRESPVDDIDISDEDLDAILGCVEKEIINLTDGKNFQGNAAVSGSDAAKYMIKTRELVK